MVERRQLGTAAACWCLSVAAVIATSVRSMRSRTSYLFAVYVDDLIIQLRQSGHGLHAEQLFIGRALYADDILFMSASCYGLYRT